MAKEKNKTKNLYIIPPKFEGGYSETETEEQFLASRKKVPVHPKALCSYTQYDCDTDDWEDFVSSAKSSGVKVWLGGNNTHGRNIHSQGTYESLKKFYGEEDWYNSQIYNPVISTLKPGVKPKKGK